jgi:tetratricopeptide (TPR) repeat protein
MSPSKDSMLRWPTVAALALLWASIPAGAQPPAAPPEAPPTAPAASAPDAQAAPEEPQELVLENLPEPPLDSLEDAVAEQLRAARKQLTDLFQAAEPPSRGQLAEHFGALGQLYQAYDLLYSAAPAYRNAARLAPGNLRWFYYLGVLAQQEGRLPEAAGLFQQTLEINPREVPARYRLAEVLRDLGETDAAYQHLELLLQLLPESPSALALMGEIELQRDNPELAAQLLERALLQEPEADRLHWPLHLAYRQLGEQEKALSHLEQRGSVGVRPPDPLMKELQDLRRGELVHILRGRLAFGVGQYQEAAKEFATAVAAAPESTTARVNLAAALSQLGDSDGALTQLREALAVDPENATAHYNLGQLLAHGGQVDEAIESLTRAVELKPGDLQAHQDLALLFRQRQDWEEALEHYRSALTIEPLNEEAKLGEGVVLTELGRYEEAIESLEHGLSLVPRQGRWAHALAQLLAGAPDLELRNGERALYLAENVHRVQPTVRTAQTLAMAQAEVGECAAAAETQRQAIEQFLREGGDEAKASPVAQQMYRTLAQYRRSAPCRYPAAEPGDAERAPLPPEAPGTQEEGTP